jgi:glycosyltransferase involved in cell wall biosynthesis
MEKTLVIQIPCFNEAQTIGITLADLPRSIPEIDRIIVLIVDDGSNDGTTEIALKNGADYVVRHRQNRGLSRAFLTGLQTALSLGADIIVNTDADNQYPGHYIADLVRPILREEADLVIGDRQPSKNEHFSPFKRWVERLGSWAVRIVSNTDVPDAPSGFRAYSRYAALRMQVYNSFSYTLETLIQAGKERMRILHVPIVTNASLRPSRLHKGILNFLWHQGDAILRSYTLYEPLRTFTILGVPFLLLGAFLLGRFVVLHVMGLSGVARHIQSVTIGGALLIFGLLLVLLGLLGDALRANRQALEEILTHLRDQPPEKISGSGDKILGSTIRSRETGNDENP